MANKTFPHPLARWWYFKSRRMYVTHVCEYSNGGSVQHYRTRRAWQREDHSPIREGHEGPSCSIEIDETPTLRGFRTYRPMADQTKGGADFSLVTLDQWGKPSCRIHGAMNKVSPSERGGMWRCLQGQCRAGCIDG